MRSRYVLCISLLTLFTLVSLPRTLYGQTVVVTNPNWFFSPYNWTIPGVYQIDGIRPQALGTNEIITNQPGAYFALSFSNSSQAVLNLDTTGMPAGGGVTSMVVQWRVDATLSPPHTLALNETHLTLATGLDSGAHTVQFWLVSSDYHQNRWARTITLANGFLAPPQTLRISGMTLDWGATAAAPTTLRSKRIVFFGDSITEGAAITPSDDAGQTYTVTCAQALNAEFGVVANPGQGWTCNIAPTSGVPTFPNAFNLQYGNENRFPLPGSTQTADYVVLNMGTNDAITGATPDSVTASALTWLDHVREYIPSSQIFVVAPFGGFCAPALQSATTQYQNTHPSDTRVAFLNLGPTAQKGIMAQVPGGTAQSYDGIHPDVATHRALGFQLAAAIQTATGRNDLNGDGKSDLILQNTTSNQIAGWFLDRATVQNGAFVAAVPDSNYQVVGSADFNNDSKPDFVFQNRVTGQIAIWYMNGTTLAGGELVAQTPDGAYKVVGVGDFNGDGKPDIVFQNQTTHQIVIWFMDGARVIGGKLLGLVPGAGYRVVGTGDFNRDGQMDLLFQDDASGTLVLWYMNGTSYAGGSVVSAVPQAGYRVEAVADFDGDGRPDIALRNADGNIAIWHLDDATVFFTEPLSVRLDPAFRIAGPR